MDNLNKKVYIGIINNETDSPYNNLNQIYNSAKAILMCVKEKDIKDYFIKGIWLILCTEETINEINKHYPEITFTKPFND